MTLDAAGRGALTGYGRGRSLARALVVAAALAAAGSPSPSTAARLALVVSGLASPLYVTHARDGSGRLFIAERAGVIKVWTPGSAAPAVFLDITDRVLGGDERGLLGLAFHPSFAFTGRLFVNYTRRPDGATAIAEFRVAPGAAGPADAASERVLLTVAQPFANHNGGMIEFGPDGWLYVGLGDGGAGFDPGNRAQNPGDLLGKILRIDVDTESPGRLYGTPPGNPFAAGGGRAEIYALGLRNPFRFSFDRATGVLRAGDVGQGSREEIDIIQAGKNYGWRLLEGSLCTGLGPCDPAAFEPPVTEYETHGGGRCAVTGGYAYRGRAGAVPAGAYVFGDFCSGEIFVDTAASVLLDTSLSIASFGEDGDGEIYVVDLGGAVYRLVPEPGGAFPTVPVTTLAAAVLPSSRSVRVGVPATAFATILNLGPATAIACGLGLDAGAPGASLAFQTTDPVTNQLVGTPGTPVDIAPGGAQTFVFALTPGGAIAPTEVPIRFGCANAPPAPVLTGVNTLLLSASTLPAPDVVALAATAGGNGIVDVSPSTQTGAFAVAAVNVGAGDTITATAHTAGAVLPVNLAICPTDPATGTCLAAAGPRATVSIGAGASSTFAVFVSASGPVPFDPASNRIVVRFTDGAGTVRGATSVAVRRQ
jgi:glucose/arabinose dehydrogenase